MQSISDAIIATPTLPTRFISEEYDKFLFFDVDLKVDVEFVDTLQEKAGKNIEICIFYSQTRALVGGANVGEKWSEKIGSAVKTLEAQGEYFGLIVAERKGSWVLVQDMPVNWGIFGFRKSDMNALELFSANAIDRDWFLSIDHFKQAIADPSSPMRDSIDLAFMKKLVINYS